MKNIPAIAIFDIGKTNKKFFLFDEQYKIVLERTVQFEETTDEDGDSCDDVNQLSTWVLETLADALQLKKFHIKAVNFSAYGASFVYIDEKGKVIAPLYNYLKPFDEELSKKFYENYGGEGKISVETASPVLGNLNSGMQLYSIKHQKPAIFKQAKYALHLPQYLNYLVTKQPCSDITSIGCHTQLWNFRSNAYHTWVTEEEIDAKLAPVLPSNEATPVSFDEKEIYAGTGLHDSSAALIPYLACFTEPFVLISTGTWCITLNPFNNIPLTTEELQKDCLCYMEYHGRPVKASRLFAGSEHEIQTKKLAAHFGEPNDHYKKVKFNSNIISKLQKEESLTKNLEDGLQKSVFAQRDLSSFKSYEEAYHRLIMDIMIEQTASSELVLKGTQVTRIFVDGGFGNNPIYMNLLAAAFPDLEVYAASVAQATAVGAALAIHKFWNDQSIPGDMIEMKYYSVVSEQDV